MENFEKVCNGYREGLRMNKFADTVFAGLTHEPQTAREIAEKLGIYYDTYPYCLNKGKTLNSSKVACYMKKFIEMGLVSKVIIEETVEIENPCFGTKVYYKTIVIPDKFDNDGNIINWHYDTISGIDENKTITVKRKTNKYSLV